ncbi:MAG: beta-ketoacyl-[acyl-carrier-protein] synthase II [Chloroflexi bacterium RBG_16_63_12]|nr:MAG: beta-ketoacyl-[acyl-carrier-protein] synthase II [Chloroflexi bacterium RBG_16_63_12]
MTRRVVITGLGTISPVGHTVKETWENIVNGVSGVGPITQFDTTNFLVKNACEVKNFDPAQYMDAKEARRRDRYQQLASAASQEALKQSGLEITKENAHRVAVIVSSAVGGLRTIETAVRTLVESGPRRISPFAIPMLMSNGASGLIAIDTGAKGPNFSVASACASGADGIGAGWMLIRSGMADAAIAGASEASIVDTGVGAFDRVGAMTHRDAGTPQPFDKERDGLVMGEGSAILILESLEHAKARGAAILAELVGYAATADAFHITAPAEDGSSGAMAMRNALRLAELNPEDLDYINAHGTGTPLNDAAETVAIKRAFGEQAYQIPVSSTKSMTGHMMGATGALEAIFCVQAIRTNTLPPTINYHTPDPACDLDYIPNTAREAKVDVTMSNAFGFGGHNAVLVIQRFTG